MVLSRVPVPSRSLVLFREQLPLPVVPFRHCRGRGPPSSTLYSMPVQPLLQSSMPVPQAIARVLEQAGIEFVFGMPGGRTGPIFDALFDHADRIRAVLVREEGLAAVMADVYARLTGKPGVAMGQSA